MIGCNPKHAQKIGIQLYTLREQLTADIPRIIGKVASAGYKQVETYGYSAKSKFWGLDPKAFHDLLKSYNLKSPGGHYGMDKIVAGTGDDDLKTYIDAASELGQDYIVVPYMADADRQTIDQYKVIAERLNKAAELCKKSNIKLGYHNHDFEFKDLGNGQTGYQVLLKETDKKLIDFEMDIYWVVRAGLDPVKLIEENPGRFTMWHVKDMDKDKPELNTEVGNGSIDFKAIFDKSEQSGMKYLFLEQENFSMDPYESIEKSYRAINGLLVKDAPRG
jgi:sugar phosphate isomerase/epimerase